jgi:hypothetical protein
VIALSADATREAAAKLNATFEETAAFLINHGAGHNAGLNHGGDVAVESARTGDGTLPGFPVNRETTVPGHSVMSSGNTVYRYVNPSTDQRQRNPTTGYRLGDFISTPSNQGVIKQYYERRFGTNTAKPSGSIKTE